jgi:hypothetical protein
MHGLLLAGKDGNIEMTEMLRREMANQGEHIKNVTNRMQQMLNADESAGPTFEMMESSLKRLVQESVGASEDPSNDEKILLRSIWLTLKVSRITYRNKGPR